MADLYILQNGTPMTGSRIIEQENGNEESTGKEHLRYLQKKKSNSPGWK
jgi:hypothetical protein